MAFVRGKKRANGRTYYYLVENHREGKRTIQKVLEYLGTEKPSPEALEKLIKEAKIRPAR